MYHTCERSRALNPVRPCETSSADAGSLQSFFALPLSRSWVAALAGGSSQLEIVGDFLHIDSDWAFFHGRGVSWLQLGVEGEQKEEVQWSGVLGSCDSDLIERNGGLMLNGREEARGCLQRVLESETGREFFRVYTT